MGRNHRHGELREKVAGAKKAKAFEPQVFVDHEADFASIKISSGVEAKSYVKDGFVFLEDRAGKIIEIQVLNLSGLARKNPPSAA